MINNWNSRLLSIKFLCVTLWHMSILPGESGINNLKWLLRMKKGRGACAAAAMRAVGLEEASGKPVGKYSLGMRQRLGIAQAIMEHPRLLVLDEPMNGLDHKGAADMRRLFSSWREQGTTILPSSHNPLDISELCDTVCEMDAGVLKPVQ